MEVPHSMRLGRQGEKLSAVCAKTGLKKSDLTRLALANLFDHHPNDVGLANAVVAFRMAERALANQRRSA